MLCFILGFLMFLSDGTAKRPVLENSLSDMTFPKSAITALVFFQSTPLWQMSRLRQVLVLCRLPHCVSIPYGVLFSKMFHFSF